MRIEQLLRSNMLDGWLMKEHNKFRMSMPKDETSLFRAVSEQVYSCQNFYEKVQNHCILYLRYAKQGLHGTVEEPLVKLQTELQNFTEVEKLGVVSQTYKRNIVLFRKMDNPVEIIGQILTTKTAIYLRLTEDGFYESIRSLEYMKNAAFCQAILYEILYEKVFKFDRETILEAVQNVRNKAYNTQVYNPQQRKSSYCSYNSSSGDEKSPSGSPDNKGEMLPYPPFPFRAAKALDPDFFRNAQYDLYLDSRRDSLHSVKPGDKVHVTFAPDDDRTFTGHVQEVSPNQGPVAVFVEELGKRTMVPYESIIRLPQQQAKGSTGARQRMRRQFMGRSKTTLSDGSDEKVGSSPDSGSSQAGHRSVLPPRFSQNQTTHPQTSRPTFHHSPPIGFQARPHTTITQPQCNINTDLGMIRSPLSPQLQQTPYYTQQRPDGIVYAQLPTVMPQLSPPLFMQPSYEDTEMTPPMTVVPNTYAQQHMGQYCQPMDCACYDGGYYLSETPMQYELPMRQAYYQEVPMLSMPILDSQQMGGVTEAASVALPVPHKDTIQVSSVNYQTQPSRDPSGGDMPLNDLDTLRYFYNLGCGYYRGVMSPGYPNYENTQARLPPGPPTIMSTPCALPTTLVPVTQMQSVPPQC